MPEILNGNLGGSIPVKPIPREYDHKLMGTRTAIRIKIIWLYMSPLVTTPPIGLGYIFDLSAPIDLDCLISECERFEFKFDDLCFTKKEKNSKQIKNKETFTNICIASFEVKLNGLMLA